MKKALIPAAVLMCLTGAAHADLTIYGLLDGSAGKAISDDQTLLSDGVTPKAKENINFHSGGDAGSGEGNSTSRFGIKGSTDVGSGIKANFKLESNGITSAGQVNQNGSGQFFGRAAWGGFSGSFGEVRFGRQDSIPFQTFIDYDYNGASNGISSAQYSNAGRWLLLGRQSDSLQYISPTLGGFKGQVGVVRKDSSVASAKDVFSAAGNFVAGPVSIAAAYQSKGTTDSLSGGNYEDYAGVAGAFDFGVGKVTLGYHDQKTQGKGFTAGMTFTVADVNFGGLFYKETNLSKGTAFELFVNKEVLKGTYAYAEVGVADKNAQNSVFGDSYGKGTGFAIGLIYTF